MAELKPSVVILYNRPAATADASEQGVLEEVSDVKGALEARGYATEEKGVRRDDLLDVLHTVAARKADALVFNLCEGVGSESRHEATIASLLDLLGIRFTGNTAATLTVALDKRVAKGLLALAGVATPHGQVFRTVPRPEVARDVRYPVVVKPLREDASLGVTPASFVRDEEELRAQVARVVAEHGQPALAESYLPGREFNAAVLGEGKAARVLPLAEISFQGYAPGEARLVTHDAKWRSGSRDCTRTVPVCPADLDPSLRTRIEEAALASHRVFECRDYARVDIRLDGRGRPHVLEVNPNPDISRAAGLARAVLASGMSYEDFVEGVALQAWRRG